MIASQPSAEFAWGYAYDLFESFGEVELVAEAVLFGELFVRDA